MKHIILLFDGTHNSAATGHFEDITNVFRLNLAISRSDINGAPQIIFYMPGPGTRGFIDKRLGGATGQGIDEIIREAYVNLASNYNPGDIIYVFGFSRGAVAARALTCVISESGLLKPEKLYKLPTAWRRFVNINRGVMLHPGLKDLTNDVHSNVKVKFLGVFDTVLGRNPLYKSRVSDLIFSNNAISPIVEFGIHLLSIDDNRKIFAPMLWDSFDPSKQTIEQIWLPGVHGDIGGIGGPHFLGLLSFLMMISKIEEKTSLRINQNYIADLIRRLTTINIVSISNERYSALMRIMPKARRSINTKGISQYSHSMIDVLHRRKIDNRGVMKVYRGKHLDNFLELPKKSDNFTDIIASVAREALGIMH